MTLHGACDTQVILALINNWETTGSADEIVRWAGFKVSIMRF